MIALIDGDVVAYMAACAAQKNIYYVHTLFDGEELDEHQFTALDEAKKFIKYMREKPENIGLEFSVNSEITPVSQQVAQDAAYRLVNRIIDDVHATQYKIYLTSNDKSNFRIKIAKTKPYKGNRKAEKPVHLQFVRDYLVKAWNAEVVHGQEADDALGIEQTKNNNDHKTQVRTVICTVDKDLMMIPGYHYNIRHPKIVSITEFEAMQFFWQQMLSGDSVDNIPGVPRFGKIKAKKLVEKQSSLSACQTVVLDEYKKAYKDEFYSKFLEMGNLLWIKREQDKIFEDIKL